VWWLVLATVLACSFTYKFRDWTGIRSSAEWGIGAGILLMVFWMAVYPRSGFKTSVLTGNLLGISIGLAIAKAIRLTELGRAIGPMSFGISLYTVPVLAYMTLNFLKRESELVTSSDDTDGEVEKWVELVKAMPEDEQRKAVEAKIAEMDAEWEVISKRLDESNKRLRTMMLWVSPLILMSLAGFIWISVRRPPTGPVSIVMLIAFPAICIGYFVFLWSMFKPDKAEPKRDVLSGHDGGDIGGA